MSKGEEAAGGDIHMKSVEELVRTIDKSSNQAFAFLIGAGASRPAPAEIPTAGELIWEFKQELYAEKHRFEGTEPDPDKVEDWAREYEAEHKSDEQHEYGFWFSKAYPKPGSRREFIREKVQDEEPPFGQIILANMMNNGVISHTFTPNFDDLLYKALYNLSDIRPLFVDHEAKAPRFNMSGDRQAIIKLHGDYLHYTQNTTAETNELRDNVRDRFEQSLTEYGLVVVGYGGSDESIMSVLEDIYGRQSESEHGLFWCKRVQVDADEFENLHDDEELLREQFDDEDDARLLDFLEDAENAEVVPIRGSTHLFAELWDGIDEIELPQPDEIREQADDRVEKIKRFKNDALDRISDQDDTDQTDEETTGDEEKQPEESKEAKSLLWDGVEAMSDGEYETAIEKLNQAIELDPENIKAYLSRGNAKKELDRYEEAIEDYNRVIKLDPESAMAYNNRGIARISLDQYEAAIEDFNQALNLDSEHVLALLNRAETYILTSDFEEAQADIEAIDSLSTEPGDKAKSLMLKLVTKIVQEEPVEDDRAEYRSLCNQDFTTDWNFDYLDTWLEDADLEPEKREEIEETLDMFRPHVSNP